MRVTAERVARTFAANRTVLGVALVVAPGVAARAWVGGAAGRAGAQVVARGLGARDIAIGLGTILALERGGRARPWAAAALISDAVDLAATAIAAPELPRPARLFGLAMTGGSTALGAWLTGRVR